MVLAETIVRPFEAVLETGCHYHHDLRGVRIA